VRLQVERDMRNIPASWKYEHGKYPPDYRVRLKYIQRGKRCDPTNAPSREFARRLAYNFTRYKNRSVGICDVNKYLECDRDTR